MSKEQDAEKYERYKKAREIKKKYDIRELQLSILDTLICVDRICKEQNLRYYLIAGTLLGAVRHKGFIPWDDDLDIAMPRSDYEKFARYADQWLDTHYEFINLRENEKSRLQFGKIQNRNTTLIESAQTPYLGGVFIDIFPLDGVPNSKRARKWHFKKQSVYNKLLFFHIRNPYKHGRGLRALPTLIIRKLITHDKISRRLNKLISKYNFDSSGSIADYDDIPKVILNKEDLGDGATLTFEGREFRVIKNYHKYLTQKYGADYMRIPDVKKQHRFFYLDLSIPYSEVGDLEKFIAQLKSE